MTVILLGLTVLSASAAEPPKMQTVVYKRAGDLEIQADVYHYPDTNVRPVIVWLHGGALIMGHREGMDRRVREFAVTNGYGLVSFDYRLAPETKLPGILEDIEDAFRWLRREGCEQFHFDADRILVAGASAGGYLTLATGHRIRPRPTVLLALFGYGDLIGDWYSTPSQHPRHNPRKIAEEEAWNQVSGPPIADSRDRQGDGGLFYNYCRQTGLWPKAVSGWDPHTQAGEFLPYMPVRNVTADYPLTVLIHGTEDTDVPIEQSEMMARELESHGVPHQFHRIEQGEHGLVGGDPIAIREAYREAFEFIRRRFKDIP